MRSGGIDKGVILLVVILAVIVATGITVVLAVRTDEISDLVSGDDQFVALVAIELDDGRLFSQVVFYQFSTARGAVFDVPGETGAVVRSLNRIDSIDTVYFTDGIDVYRNQIAELIGVEIPFHIHLDEERLEAVVDLLGGILLFVTDLPNEGPEAVRIPSGDVVLDGAKTREYLRYAGDGEREREPVARRQKLAMSLLSELGDNGDELAGRFASRVLTANVTTNIGRAAFVSLMREFDRLETDRMITRQIEGTSRRVVAGDEEKLLLFPHQEGRWLKESVRQVVENLASHDAIRDENIVIRLEILNGTDISGFATRTAQLYRSYGFDVVAVGNAQSNQIERTLVVDRVASEILARRAADIIRAPFVESEPDPQAAVDVTVILGKDFDGRYVR